MTTKPAAWATRTSGAASAWRSNAPKPTFASQTPSAASSGKSEGSSVGSTITEPPSTVTPPGRSRAKLRWAASASAFTPARSTGRPGRCTSEADIIIVTPPWSDDSI